MRASSRWPGSVAVAAVALLASLVVIGNQFTFDDAGLIVGTDRLHGLAHWRDILTKPYWPPPFAEDLYRPLTSLLLAVQYAVGNGEVWIFRLTSMLLYAGASLGVLSLARRVTSPAIAVAVGLLFAAHPVHVEAVALAVAQAELVVAIAGTVMVARYLGRRQSEGGTLSRGDWTLLAVCYFLACVAKEHGLLLPALLIAAELCLVRPVRGAARIRPLAAGYAGLAAIGLGVLLVRSQVLHGQPFLAAPAEALRGLDLGARALTMLGIVPEWFRLLVWPVHLRADYSPSEFVASAGFGASEAFGLALLVVAVALLWLARRRAPAVTFGLAWFFITILPVSNVLLPTGVLLAERNLFLPSIGFLLSVGGGIAWLGHRAAAKPVVRLAAIAAGLALVAAGVLRSVSRQQVYADQTTLTTATVRDAPRSARVRQAYAEMLFEQGQTVKGLAAYRKAIELSYEPWVLRIKLARRLRLLGDTEGALEELRLSLAQKPTKQGLGQLAAALLAAGKYAEAQRIAEGLMASDNAPPAMVHLKRLADSAIAVKAPPGSIRIGID